MITLPETYMSYWPCKTVDFGKMFSKTVPMAEPGVTHMTGIVVLVQSIVNLKNIKRYCHVYSN